MKRLNVNVDLIAVFVIINSVGIIINEGVNPKNKLIKEYAIQDFLRSEYLLVRML